MPTYLETALAQDVVSIELKIYLKDDGIPSGGSARDPEWVDFTDRVGKYGKDLLQSIGVVSNVSEGKAGTSSFISSIRSAVFSNEDGFFSKPILTFASATTADFYGDSYKSNMLTIKNNSAYFTYTYNYTNTVYEGRKVKISMRVQAKTGSVSQGDLGIFLIEDVSRTTKRAVFTLTSLAQPLIDRDASLVKNGLSHYSNKSINFLVEKLLEQEYAESDGSLPSTFNIQKNIRIQTASSLTGENADNRTLSVFGRPPERSVGTEASLRSGSGGDSSTSWLEKGYVTRALLSVSIGTNSDWNNIVVAAAADNATTLQVGLPAGAGITFTSQWTREALRPVAGDSITIKNDTTGGNDGTYFVSATSEVLSTMILTLTTPLKGRATSLASGGLEFNISRLYVGADDELWIFRPERDLYSSLDITTLGTVQGTITNLPSTGYKMNINRLWFSSTTNYIFGAAWHPMYDPSRSAGDYREYSQTTSMQIFSVTESITAGTEKLTTMGSVLDDVYTGEFCTRIASQTVNDNYAAYCGQMTSGSDENSENVVLPFAQKVTGTPFSNNDTGEQSYLVRNATTNAILTQATITTESPDAGTNLSKAKAVQIMKSYIAILIGGEDCATTFYMDSALRFSIGARGFVVLDDKGQNIFYCKFKHNATVNRYFNYYHFKISDNSSTLVRDNRTTSGVFDGEECMNSDGYALAPTVGCDIEDMVGIVVCQIAWRHSGGTGVAGECDSFINVLMPYAGGYEFRDNPLYDSNQDSANEKYTIFTDIIQQWDSGDYLTDLLVTGFYRDRLKKDNMYFLAYLDGDTVDTLVIRKTSANPFKGLVRDAAEITTGSIFVCYYVEGERGVLYKYDISSTTHTFTMLDNGHQYTEGESHISGNLTLDSYSLKDDYSSSQNRTIIYGVSAPTENPETQLNTPTGKYYLWMYSVFYSGRVETADFTDLSIYNALGLLAEKCQYIQGFDGEDFFFVPREISPTVSYTFGNIETDKEYVDISIDGGLKEVYNVCNITPSVTILQQPSTELKLVANPSDANLERDKMKLDIVVQQRDNKKKSLRLICTQAGKLDANEIEFKYLLYEKTIETTLSTAYSLTDTVVYISSGIQDVDIGDEIELRTQEKASATAPKEYVGRGTVETTPSQTDIENNKITLSAVLNNYEIGDFSTTDSPTSYPINSSVIITKVNSSKWSDGIENKVINSYFEKTVATDWTATACTISANVDDYVIGSQCLKVLASESSTSCVSQTISGLETSTEYSVMAFCKTDGLQTTTDTVSHLGYLDVTGTTTTGWTAKNTYNEEWTKLSGHFTTGSNTSVVIKLYGNDNVATSALWYDSVILQKGYQARPTHLLMYKDSVFYEIGDSNILIKGIDPNKATEDAARFEVGDIIEITCPGLVLSADSLSKQTTINALSVKNYGRKEFPEVQNRFLAHKEAKDMSKKIVYDYAFPKNIYRIQSKFAPFLSFINNAGVLGAFKVIDQELLPISSKDGRKGYLRRVDHDPRSGKTTVVIRDEDPY